VLSTTTADSIGELILIDLCFAIDKNVGFGNAEITLKEFVGVLYSDKIESSSFMGKRVYFYVF